MGAVVEEEGISSGYGPTNIQGKDDIVEAKYRKE
jgi:hypothetical protein